MIRLITVILAAVFSVSVMGSMHEEGKHSKKSGKANDLPAFSKIDKNDDDKLSWEEAQALNVPKEEFDNADYDDDGKISRVMYQVSFDKEQT